MRGEREREGSVGSFLSTRGVGSEWGRASARAHIGMALHCRLRNKTMKFCKEPPVHFKFYCNLVQHPIRDLNWGT